MFYSEILYLDPRLPTYLPIELIPIRFSLRMFGLRTLLNSNFGPCCSFFIKPKTSDHFPAVLSQTPITTALPCKFDEVTETSDFDEKLIYLFMKFHICSGR